MDNYPSGAGYFASLLIFKHYIELKDWKAESMTMQLSRICDGKPWVQGTGHRAWGLENSKLCEHLV